MSHNYRTSALINQLPRTQQPGEMAAYLLGMGPLPPPTQQEMTVNRLLDQQGGGREESSESSGDENIVPHHRGSQMLPPVVNNAQTITVQVPVNNQVVRDIVFPLDIPRHDFFNRIFAAMGLDPTTAQLGWKKNDEPKRTAPHRLADESDVNDAFKMLVNIMNNPRRQREVVMVIVHLNPAPAEIVKKVDGGRITNFAYADELRMVQEKLHCAQHGGPNRWCYVSPENPAEHIALGLEEVTLWARKIHDNDADNDCFMPPNCLRLDNLRKQASRVCKNSTKADVTPVHVHINNNALADSSTSTALSHACNRDWHPTLKRPRSVTSSSIETETESLALSDVLQDLHKKLPKLNLPQYENILREKGILYAESVQDFNRDYYVQLGMAVGAVGVFMSGVRKAVEKEIKMMKAAKRSKVSDKENAAYSQAEGMEV